MAQPTPSEIASALRAALTPYPDDVAALDFTRLRATGTIVTERPDGSTELSDAILDACFPNADSNKDFFHYTTLTAFERIIDRGELRLFWIKKRLKDYEYQPFCDEHGLDGYTTPDPQTGILPLETLCRDLFYISVSEHPNNPALWDTFAEQGNGVRLRLKMTPMFQRSHLRTIRYGQAKTVIRVIQETISTQFGLRYVLRGTSRAPAFSLPMFLNDENETRLLIKRFSAVDGDFNPWRNIRSNGPDEYLPIRLCQPNDFCRVDLNGVGVLNNTRVDRLRQFLDRSHDFSFVPVECART